MTCTSYCKKIEEIWDVIIRLSDEVLPENRSEVNSYISLWDYVMVWVKSIKRDEGTEALRERFDSHVATEEERLRRNLEDIKYDIDSTDTVRLIAGNGRLETVIFRTMFFCFCILTTEQHLFPLLYLALKRDLERISLARKYVLSHFELWDALESIFFITGTAWHRLSDLRGGIEA